MADATILTGKKLQLNFDVENRGTRRGSQTVELLLDGTVVDENAVVLDSTETGQLVLETDAFSDDDEGEVFVVETVIGTRTEATFEVEVSDIPDSAVYYWLGESFADPWPDDVQELDMSVTGLSSTTVDGHDAVAGDGTDGGGEANIEDYASDWDGEAAFEIAFRTTDDEVCFVGFNDDTGRFAIGVGNANFTNGETSGVFTVRFEDDGGNTLEFEGETIINDGELHSLVINKTGNSWSNGDFDAIVDGSEESLSTPRDETDDLSNIPSSWGTYMGFWKINNDGDDADEIEADIVGFGFHDATLSGTTLI